MKKKVFSKLLMVALVATVGAFTSCKDYDDDINDLRSQINGLETSLKATIDKNASDAANSLAILEKQLADVKVAYADADAALDTQLKALKNDVSTAMTSLQGGIDANKANIATNLEAINNLKSEVASLKTAVGTLEAAKESLEKSLKETNDLLKSQGETIATLVQADQNLQKAIDEAKALATKAQEAADAAQKAADKVAADLATLTTQEAADVANLQKQISDNLTSLTKKIDDVNATLSAAINTNTQSISDLATKMAENYATIVYVDKQIDAVKAANTKVANDLAAAQTALEAQITKCGTDAADALKAAKEAIYQAIKDGNDIQDKALEAAEKRLKDADDKQDAYLAAQLIDLNTKIGNVTAQALANAHALDLLEQKEIDDYAKLAKDLENAFNTLTATHNADLDLFKNQVITEIIPTQVATQVAYYVPKAMQDFFDKVIKPYVDNVDEKHTTLLNEFIERFEADSIKLDTYLAGEYLLAIQALVGDTADVLRDEMAVTAQNLKDAYEFADNQLKQNLQGQIDDMNNPEKEGSLANLLKTAKENLQGQITTANGKIEAIETFLGKSEEGFSYETLAASIAATEVFGNAIEDAVKKANGEMLQMITSINLYANQHHAQDNEGGFEEFDHDLIFTYAIEKDNIFPAADLQQFVDGTLEFVDGYVHTQTDKVLVRVSPTNADLADVFEADPKAIALFNSKGENIVGSVIKVVSVKRYDREGYITRSEGPQTGLWEIEFKLVEEKEDVWQKFEDAAFTEVNGEQKQILYAVGVKTNEVAEGKAERYAVSEYDLALGTKESFHSYDFFVGNESVAKIHNRYIVNENKPNSQTAAPLWTADEVNFPETYAVEQTYAFDYSTVSCDNDIDFPAYTPAEIAENAELVVDRFMNTDNKAGGYNVNGVDNRHDFPVKLIKFDRLDADGNLWADIDIEFPKEMCDGQRQTKIAGFYVTLDQEFADESGSSEASSWTSYWYDGVGFKCETNGQIETQITDEARGVKAGICKAKLFKGTSGTISIKDFLGAKRDVIGFRVYAVNLDGTLTDPDGRAFYVRSGDEGTAHNLVFNVETFKVAGDAAKQTSDDIAGWNDENDEKFFNILQTELNKGNYYTIDYVWAENDAQPVVFDGNKAVKPVAGTKGYASRDLVAKLFDFTYSSDADAAVDGDSWKTWNEIATGTYTSEEAAYKDIQNVKVTLKAADCMVDGATYYLTATVTLHQADRTETVVNTIGVEITKVMPTKMPDAFKVRGASTVAGPKYNENVYIRPMKYVNRALVPFGGSTGKTWDIDEWFDASAEDYGYSTLTDSRYLWASDTRPYNLEEMFVGLILNKNQYDVNTGSIFRPHYETITVADYDPNYIFEFEGCGNYAENDSEGDAVSTFHGDNNAALTIDMSHYGLNTDNNEEIVKTPRYTIPYVYADKVIGKNISVKAGYIYRGISYNPEEGVAAGSDYTLEPQYFDALGHFVAKAEDAAFKVTFRCALEGKVGNNEYGKFEISATAGTVGITAYDANAHVTTAYDGVTAGKEIPYGNNFDVIPTSVSIPTVKWSNTLPVYKNGADEGSNVGASYHRVAFDKITPATSAAQTGNYYNYSTGAMTPNSKWLLGNFAGLVQTAGPEATVTPNGIVPGKNKLTVTGGKYKVNGAEFNLSKAELEHFYTITTTEDGVVKFKALDNTDMPSGVEWIKVFVSSESTSYKVVSQWKHESAVKTVTPAALTINIGDPYSSQNIQARQSR